MDETVVGDGNRNALAKIPEKDREEKLKTQPVYSENESYGGEYYIATYRMDEPGEIDARLVNANDDEEIHDYESNGWDLDGPYSEEEAHARMEKYDSDNKKWKYYSSNQFDDRDDYDLGNLHDFDRGDF